MIFGRPYKVKVVFFNTTFFEKFRSWSDAKRRLIVDGYKLVDSWEQGDHPVVDVESNEMVGYAIEI